LEITRAKSCVKRRYIYAMKSKEVSADRRLFLRRLGFVDWAATLPRKASNRMVQQVLLDDFLTLEDLCWIQRWAALLPELVADFEDSDQSHLATKLRAKLRLADVPGPETRRHASERRMKRFDRFDEQQHSFRNE
jgi:hypothetical protein